MKRLLLATTSILWLAAGSAVAADMAVKAPRAAPCACECAAKQFGGVYVGISGGGAKHIANRTDQDQVLVDASTYVLEKWGGIVGGTLGYNWANCNTVWGVEIDGSWVGTKNSLTLIPNSTNPQIIDTQMNSLFTARVRTGLTMDNLMLYLTGGFAGARFKTAYTDAGIDGFATGISEWRWGWVAGFGTEWAWSQNVSLKSEVLYVNFTDRENRLLITDTGGTTFPANFTHSDQVWVSRVGLNFRFGGAPVAAKY